MSEGRKRRLVEDTRRPREKAEASARPGESEDIILKIAALLHRLVEAARQADEGPGADSMLIAVRDAIETRRRRERIFGNRLFAEPSWDILLDLFVATLEGRRISVSSACIAASAPTTTALRHIAHLVQEGLISRRPHPSDARSVYLEITDVGTAKLTEFFTAWPVAPDNHAA